jgi:hypothetical protein
LYCPDVKVVYWQEEGDPPQYEGSYEPEEEKEDREKDEEDGELAPPPDPPDRRRELWRDSVGGGKSCAHVERAVDMNGEVRASGGRKKEEENELTLTTPSFDQEKQQNHSMKRS